jgi:hypothetical protein
VPAADGHAVLELDAVGVPPGVPALEPADDAAWDAVLARAGASPRSA